MRTKDELMNDELIILDSEDRAELMEHFRVMVEIGIPLSFAEAAEHATAMAKIASAIFTEEELDTLSETTKRQMVSTLMDIITEEE